MFRTRRDRITLISVSLKTDDIVYPSERLRELAEKVGSITFGAIGCIFVIVNIYWVHRVGGNESTTIIWSHSFRLRERR